jgi:hypothetical protein
MIRRCEGIVRVGRRLGTRPRYMPPEIDWGVIVILAVALLLDPAAVLLLLAATTREASG